MANDGFKDKELVCGDCDKTFIWSAGEQKFFEEKGFKEIPKRCSDCRAKKREELKKFNTKCGNCGNEMTLSFKPIPNKKYFCDSCFDKTAEPNTANTPVESPTENSAD